MIETSAGRLHTLLQTGGEKHNSTFVDASGRREASIGRVWVTLVDAAIEDKITILALHGEVLLLIKEVESDFYRLHGSKAPERMFFLQAIARNFNAVSPEMGWSALAEAWSPANMSTLLLADSMFEQHFGLATVEAAMLNEWRTQIEELRAEIEIASIDTDLKRTLLEILDQFLFGITTYVIRGARGLRQKGERAFGYVLVRKYTHPDATEEEKHILKKVVDVAATVLSATDAGIGVYNALAPVFHLPQLPSGK